MPSIKLKNRTTGQYEKLPIFRLNAGGGTSDHAELSNLDYANSGHTGFQPAGNYLTEESDPTVPSHVKAIQQTDITNWNNKANQSDIPTNVSELTNDAGYQNAQNVSDAVSIETSNRITADSALQSQIDALSNANDVVDVLATYQELQVYDTTNLKNNDIIKVMTDSTQSNAISYYKWTIVSSVGSWTYIGSQGPFYTKSETNTLLGDKEDTSNKTTTLSASSTNTQYPGAKCVYDYIENVVGNINTALENIINGGV